MAESMKKWYILRAISGKETKVKELVEAACKNNPDTLGKDICKVLVPTETVYTTRAGKKVQKERNLFSGYVFVQLALHKVVDSYEKDKDGKVLSVNYKYELGDTETFLQNTSNVIDFVRSRKGGKQPESVPEAQIARMLGAAEEVAASDAVEYNYIVGEKVKVNYGPFTGFHGEISEINQERHELTVIVKVFDRETPLKLDNSQVERE
ncbi:MAG: transcription termination/antitermination factor NusG [Bacteroidales bacterium]|nr:transcription termination/antitermination factor NusG [Candidatus Sodaliphilus limicaballi]